MAKIDHDIHHLVRDVSRTVQLRRYLIVPGELDAFAGWWAATMPALRAPFGFTIEFAYAVPELNEFVWAVSVPGPRDRFDEADRAWGASPARAAMFEGLPERVEKQIISFVDNLDTQTTSTSTMTTSMTSTTQKG